LILRGIEDSLLKSAQFHLTVKTRTEVALYILNEKRGHLSRLHADQGVFISVVVDETLPHADFALERTSDQARALDTPSAPRSLEPYTPADEDFEDEIEDEDEDQLMEDLYNGVLAVANIFARVMASHISKDKDA
jgi:ribonuclease E